MTMIYHDLVQGSPEWVAHRARSYNASEAAVMLGCSPYATRTELLAVMKTGIAKNISDFTQHLFDGGHRFEQLARPLAEKIIGEPLSPVTGSRGKLSASFDGLTFDASKAFEHKMLSATLAAILPPVGEHQCCSTMGDELPLHHRYQMEQQMLVSGAVKVLFMATRWSDDDKLEDARACWYDSNPELRAHLVPGWRQFERDLADFVPVAAVTKPSGRAPEALPALHIQITGGVQASNLAEFKQTALTAIRAVNRSLVDDQSFADAEKAGKWCADIEERIKAAKEHALGQTAAIDQLFRTMDEISAEARAVRLDLDKLVKARKEAIKIEIVTGGKDAMHAHIAALNAAMPGDFLPTIATDFAGAIKNLRTIESLRNAVNSELARGKIEADAIATRIHTNIKAINAAGSIALFADQRLLVLKAPDDLAAIISMRLAAEAARKESDRLTTLSEEAARVESENAAKVAAQEQLAAQEQAAAEAAAAPPADESMQWTPEQIAAIESGDALPLTFNMIQSEAEQAKAYADAAHTGIGMFGVSDGQFKRVAPLEFKAQPADTDKRINLSEINARLAPVAITVAGLSELGFEPVEQVKASRLLRESDFAAICQAISAHVLTTAAMRKASTV